MTATTVPFTFEGAVVRVIMRVGEPWFVVADLCKALGLTNPSKAVQSIDPDDRTTLTSSYGRPGHGPQSHIIISEPAMYTLVLRSRDALKPGTLPYRFRKWVTTEVLPSIRRTGRYAAPVPEPADVAMAAFEDPKDFTGSLSRRMRLVELALRVKGRKAAAELWRTLELPGHDTVMQPAEPGPRLTLEADGWRCLRTLLDHPLSPDLSVAEALGHLRQVDQPGRCLAERLGRTGIRVDPPRDHRRSPAGFAVSNTAAGLELVYHRTEWSGRGWRRALLDLPGAASGPVTCFGNGRRSRTVVVPWACMDR